MSKKPDFLDGVLLGFSVAAIIFSFLIGTVIRKMDEAHKKEIIENKINYHKSN